MSVTEQDTSTRGLIRVGDHLEVEVRDCHGDNWFPVHIDVPGSYNSTLYLRRAQLHALRVRLDEIDDGLPQPEPGR